MDQHAIKLQDYINQHGIAAKVLWFEQSCHSVREAAQAVGGTEDEFVKNICLILPDGRLAVAIVKGEDKVDLNKVADLLGIVKPKPATPEQILERTGYPCGGTPSFGYDALFLVDTRVFEKEKVYSGGGSVQALTAIATNALLAANGGRTADIRKTPDLVQR